MSIKKVLILSGEVSGDMLAGGLVRSLKKINSEASYFAMGGEGIKSAGAELIADINELSVMGFTEVLIRIKKIYAIFKRISRWITVNRPDLVILVDFPSFNLKIARLSHGLGIPVVYFIPPKIWASRYKRIRLIKKYIKLVIVIFPFEIEIYKKEGIEAYYFGNPLYFKYITSGFKTPPREGPFAEKEASCLKSHEKLSPVIAFLPGSRKPELRYHSLRIIKSMRAIKSEYPDALFLIPFRQGIDFSYFLSALKKNNIPEEWFCITGSVERTLKKSDLFIVASGTASLEGSFFKKPMIIVYYLNYLTYLIARAAVRVKYIGLINIIAGKPVVPELIESDFNPENVLSYVKKMLSDKEYSRELVKEISDTVEKLKTDSDIYEGAARLIYGKIDKL